jgi:hypothetical protein
MQLLIDTRATTTFINQKTLRTIKQYTYINKHSYSFVLADGIAPFHVLGIVELHIQFSNQITKIHAHVAQNLCTDIILGMDYITRYNLRFDLQKQTVSIEYHNNHYEMNISKDVHAQFIPVILSKSICIPSNSNRSAKVSVPISSIYSSFIPTYEFSPHSPLFISHKFLHFRNHRSHITLSNYSFHSQFISRGTCVGYLCRYSITSHDYRRSSHLINPCGIAKSIGKLPDSCNFVNDRSFRNYLSNPVSCATINRIHSSTEKDLRSLTNHIQLNPFLGAAEGIDW